MTFRSLIISLLLSAFVFIAFHDYVVGYDKSNTHIAFSLSATTDQPLCATTTIHETIHHNIVFCKNEVTPISLSAMLHLPYFTEPSQPLKPLQPNIDRPPIA